MMDTKTGLVPRLYMKLIPIQVILVVISGVNAIIDNIFAGNFIGTDAMAATGLFSPAALFLNALNALLFGGAQVLCGRYLGRKMAERTKSIFSLDIISMVIISAVFTVSCEVFPQAVSGLLGASGVLNDILSMYIRGFAIGLPALCIGSQFTIFLQLEHKEKYSYIGMAAMFAANTFLNWLFISVFDMGLFGLGLSTSIGNFIFFAIQGTYFLTGRSVIGFDIKSIILSDLPEMLKNGLPGAIFQLCIFTRGIIINRMIQTYVGTDGLSAISAISSFGAVYWCFPAGVTSSVMVLASIFAGEEDKTSLRTLIRVFMRRGVPLVIGSALLYSSCSYFMTNIFFHDPSAPVYKMTLLGFILFPLSTPLSAVTVGFTNYYHCLQHEPIVRTVGVSDGCAASVVLALLLVPVFGMTGVWMTQVLNGVVSILLLLIFAAIYEKRIPTSLDGMMCYPKDFGVAEEDRIDISAESIEDVINISEKVWDFCIAHETDRKHTLCAALCVEELAGNIVAHGFSDGKKHSIDIRVSDVKGTIVICLKDDCRAFDPKEAAELFEPGDIAHNVGLRLAARLSKSMNYQNTLGLNILTITI